jgi:hypothetical protein
MAENPRPYARINLLSRKAKDQRQAQAMQQAIGEGKEYKFKKKSNAPTTVTAGGKSYTASGRGTEVESGTVTTTEAKPAPKYKITVDKPGTGGEKKTFVPGDMQGNKINDRKTTMHMSSMMKENPAKTQKRMDEQESMENKSKLGILNDEDEKKVKGGYTPPAKTSHGGKEYYGRVKTEKQDPEKKEVEISGIAQTTTTKKPYVKVSPMKSKVAARRDISSSRTHVKWLDSKKETKNFTKMANQSKSTSQWSGGGYRYNKIKKGV